MSFIKGVATGRIRVLGVELQVQALSILAASADAEDLVELAKLLQPAERPIVRRAAADVLGSRGCPHECVGSVVHYLEMIFEGTPNLEETGLDERVDPEAKITAADNAELYARLWMVLEKSGEQTEEILTRSHGLGSGPTPFALNLLTRVRLPQICTKLIKANQPSSKQDLDRALDFQACEH